MLTFQLDTAWERINLSSEQKCGVWNTENGWILLANGGLPVLRKQLPRNGQSSAEISDQNRALFVDLELFFVKVSNSICDKISSNISRFPNSCTLFQISPTYAMSKCKWNTKNFVSLKHLANLDNLSINRNGGKIRISFLGRRGRRCQNTTPTE